jgi:NifU-like protein involved in Fe-S cluster formation
MATIKEVFDHLFQGLLGDNQQKVARLVQEDLAKDEESAQCFLRTWDELKARVAASKGGK